MKGLVVLCLAGCATFGASPPTAPPRSTHLGLDLERFELMNGLKVVLVHDPTTPEVEVTMRYAVGGIDEPAGEAGIAHLVEHLMFQQVLGSETLFAHLEAGASEFNGATTYDATTYVARANPERLDELLSIEAVRAGLRCTSITDSVFEREREVVVNELRQRSEARGLRDALHGAAFAGGHPYRTALGGDEASVAAITRAQACAFADAHYAPNNAVLVVTGDVNADQLQTSLKKFLTHLARREITPQVAVPAPQLSGVLNIDAPVDRDGLIVTWPLPQDPAKRVQVRALAEEVAVLADRGIRGRIELVELGDLRSPVLGLVALPAQGESIDAAKRAISTAVAALGAVLQLSGTLTQLEFDRVQQHATYRLFASLEPGPTRDAWLAAEVLAGRDPSATLAAEFHGLRGLERTEAAGLVETYLALDHSQVTVLKASGRARGHDAVLAPAIHDLGQRRDPPDPALAHAALADTTPQVSTDAMRTRTLANGMRVVLVPLATVPTVDVRLVFATGTADEPSNRRGVALLAADTLSWDFRYLNDMLTFASAGGEIAPEVGFDHTAFIARGLDMHIDYLLAGLRRVVREGRYDAKTVAAALHREAKRDDDDGALTDAWRAALYGPGHPYVVAGVVRHIAGNITREDLEQFRATRYVPANATLVIAGHFDVDLADRWIDYLFGDWTDRSSGGQLVRSTAQARPQPIALARYADTAQVGLGIAIPATGSLAARLVVAEMLSAVASEVRHELGASYSSSAELDDQRLASDYILQGFIETGRAEEATKLLAARIAALRDDPDAAARAFVTARARVVTRMHSLAGGASALAAGVEADLVHGRPPLSNLETARAAAGLTIDELGPSLAALDLSRALIAVRGPEPAVTAVLAALGRTATALPPTAPTIDTDEEPPSTAPVAVAGDDAFDPRDIEPAITEDQATTQATAAIAGGYTFGTTNGVDLNGFSLAGQLGYRIDPITSFGLHLDGGYGAMDYTVGIENQISHHVSVLPFDAAAYIQGDALGHIWGEVFLGLHVDRYVDAGMTTVASWQTGLVAGLGVGLDVYRERGFRVSFYGRVAGVVMSDTGFSAFTAGLALRR